MSIRDLIRDRVRREMLYPLWPKRQRNPARRALFLTPELRDAVFEPSEDQDWEARRGTLRADMEHFVTSRELDPKYLFHLYPARDCVWEIRSTREAPSIRVLGCFADQDIFVATTFGLREELGGWQSREWKQIKRRANAKWNHLFHPYQPRPGKNARTHVTGAIKGEYFRNRS